MPMAGCLSGEGSKAAIIQRLDGFLGITLQGHEHLDSGLSQASKGPTTKAPTNHRIHGPGTEELQGLAGAVNMARTTVWDGLILTRVRVHKGEERGAAEMIRR